MSRIMEMQKRYFTSQLRQLETSPMLNREKIADCRQYLSMLDGSGDIDEFSMKVRESGNMVSTARAESLDRYGNRAFIYDSMGQERKAEADRMRLDVIRSSRTHAELAEKLEEFEGTDRREYNENKAIMAVNSIMSGLFHLCTDMPGSSDEERSLIKFRTYWEQMQEADPDITWERLISYRPYRDRMIFTDSQLQQLEKKFREVNDGSNG